MEFATDSTSKRDKLDKLKISRRQLWSAVLQYHCGMTRASDILT